MFGHRHAVDNTSFRRRETADLKGNPGRVDERMPVVVFHRDHGVRGRNQAAARPADDDMTRLRHELLFSLDRGSGNRIASGRVQQAVDSTAAAIA